MERFHIVRGRPVWAATWILSAASVAISACGADAPSEPGGAGVLNQAVKGAHDDDGGDMVVAPTERVRGRTYGQWSAEWWRWAYSSHHPARRRPRPMIRGTAATLSRAEGGDERGVVKPS